MLILAIDTCDWRGSVAILQEGTVRAALPHQGAGDYSIWLLPAVDRALHAAKVTLRDIELYAVAAGPGSFTGLRVGLTSVKAWSEVYRRPVAPVSRLEALAEHAAQSSALMGAFVDARRAQIFAGFYERTSPGVVLIGEESVTSPDAFLQYVSHEAARRPVAWVSLDPDLMTSAPAWAARVALGESIVPANPILAPAIGQVALRRAGNGELVDALTLDANYVRRSDAELFWKDTAGHGG